jgi:CheY-like chemotaxis protein
MMPTEISNPHVFVVEDSQSKWRDIKHLLAEENIGEEHIALAQTLVQAEDMIFERAWSFMILDVSLDIAKSKNGHGGHDVLGGLRLAQKMHLLGCEVPTIIVTAFDAFPASESYREGVQILGLAEVNDRAQAVLGNKYVGHVRYGDPDWKKQFKELLKKVA